VTHEPRLVWRFLAVTAVGLAAAGLGIAVVVERALADQSEQQAVQRARVTTSALLDQRLTAADLRGPPTAARSRKLASLLAERRLGEGSEGGTLYGAEGAVFSTAAQSLRTPASASVTRARSGVVTSTVEKTKAGRVLRTFLPVRVGGSVGVVELDQDYDAIASSARHTALIAAAILEALLVVLCAVLLPPLATVSRRLRKQVVRLDWLASHDELTGLLSRRGFTRAVDDVLRADAARGAVLVLDIDRFRDVNETIGSDQADRLLTSVAERLRTAFAEQHTARLGEDEFALLLAGTRDPAVAQARQSIETAFEAPFVVNGIRLGLGVHVGAVRYPDHGRDAGTLLRHASIALTHAKTDGEGLALYTNTQERNDFAQLTLISDLRAGLRNGEVVAHYQPQVDLGTGAIRGVEALVRWQHPERGLLSAGEFVPTVERTDLITQLGRHVLAESIAQWRRWRTQGVSVDVAVNLSTIDLLDLTLPGAIVDLLIEHGMPADRLILEITESTLLHDEHRTHRVLRQLERIGICLAIDDFGTGYSSLATLRRLPIRQVKIDRSFVNGIPDDTDNDTIVQSTIQLAHTLGATVVAEGVETRTQLERLAALGCDTAQGYLIGRPAPPEDLVSRLTGYETTLSSAPA
jgi:diguanylate cyclase (GGDEF)-like protein